MYIQVRNGVNTYNETKHRVIGEENPWNTSSLKWLDPCCDLHLPP